MPQKVDYGVDAPGVIRNLLVAGAAGVVAGYFFPPVSFGSVRIAVGSILFLTGGIALTEALLMILYVKHGKLKHRDQMLQCISWTGSEQVLDVGTGRGLLLIGAAKRLTSGKATGIDIWSKTDLSGNSMEGTLQNAALEGVSAKVELKSEDARAMKFADGAFDVILSNLCLHNIPSKSERAQACREIGRVLMPGGTAVISDFRHTGDYAAVFRDLGLGVRLRRRFSLDVFPPLTVLKVQKPR